MKIKNEVILHENSINYLKETLSQYTVVETLGYVSNPIIHIYPKEDTYEQDGSLSGYIDALFSEIHIYDSKKMTVWKSGHHLHDGIIPFSDINVSQIKAFKDLSFMVALIGEYSFSPGTALSIRKVK